MNAAVLDAPPRRARKIDNRDRAGLEGELERWGDWHDKYAMHTGFPAADALTAYLEGAGGGKKGDTVLCPEMPQEVYWTQQRVLSLKQRQRDAIFVKYVCTVNEGGQLISDEQRAAYLKLTREAFGMLLTRAKQRMLGIGSDDT